MNINYNTPWLFPYEQEHAIEQLLRFGLIKWDNKRRLPLKSGGKTDIYITLRNARNYAAANDFLAQTYIGPLKKLGVDRFVEVPDSVSCFAGPLSITTNVPYLTIRSAAKEGRVSDTKIIGDVRYGDRVAIMDDVITDGDSKIGPSLTCAQRGLIVEALVVLVDRQQGWRQHLPKNGVHLPVWAGMTLHDVRRFLIGRGLMERCAPEVEETNPLIVALDGKSWEEILPVIDELRTTGCILKVNDLLTAQGADQLLPNLSVYGRVMVDYKFHDIPNTVANHCGRLRKYEPWAVTVHGSGSEEMMKAAVGTLRGSNTKVLAIMVLTSIDQKMCEEVYSRRPMEQVLKIAELAHRAGVHGLVCSPEEVKKLRGKYPDMTLVTPGIRAAGSAKSDQKRVATPRATRNNGADYLVVGRPIMWAENPAEAAISLREEVA